ncbi:MAG: ATP-binding protein [bacterium]
MIQLIHKIRNRSTRKPTSNLHQATEELLHSLNLIIGLDQLLENFTAKLQEIFRAHNIYVILIEPITDRYVGKKAKGNQIEWLAKFNFSHSDNLIKWLNVNRCALDVGRDTEVVKFLSSREQELLHKTDTVLVVPLIAVNRLTGALFIGKKLNGTPYSPSELEILSILASQSAIAVEHALMLQYQEDRLKSLFHTDKLATVGELAAGAAHEIRNPLTSIRSTVQFLKKELPEKRKGLISGIIEEVDRIDQIIEGLLSFSKSSELKMAIINLEELINQTLLLLDSELRNHNINVQKQFELSNANITADASQLKQVFLNILLNSIQAMPQGGSIILTLMEADLSDTRPDKKDLICVKIIDTGCGIPEQELPKVFDPFYTTKESGTGLGLSISYGIVRKHGGDIEIVSSTQGKNMGTTVIIWLPRKVIISDQ